MFLLHEKFSQGIVAVFKNNLSEKCVSEESVDSSSLKCPVDGQTFKGSRAQTLRVSCSNNSPPFDGKNIMELSLMFFLGLNFPFYCKTAKDVPRLPSPEGFCWKHSVQRCWKPSLLQRSSNPQQDLEATEGLHFSLFDQRDNSEP